MKKDKKMDKAVEQNSEEVIEETKPEGVSEDSETSATSENTKGDCDAIAGLDEIEALKKEVCEKNDLYLRTVAEYQNFRKRTEKEKSDIYKYANEKVFADLLPLMDNFERAIEMFDPDQGANFKEGMELIKKSLDDLFAKHEVMEIKAIGKEFDHNFHHAVMTAEAEGVEPNTVIEVLQKGYVLNDKVIRPAMVKVTPH